MYFIEERETHPEVYFSQKKHSFTDESITVKRELGDFDNRETHTEENFSLKKHPFSAESVTVKAELDDFDTRETAKEVDQYLDQKFTIKSEDEGLAKEVDQYQDEGLAKEVDQYLDQKFTIKSEDDNCSQYSVGHEELDIKSEDDGEQSDNWADTLPVKFTNVIVSSGDGRQNIINIRSSIKNMEDINEWVLEFGKNSFTNWNARTSIPQGEKIVCSKKFVCHHSAFMKIPSNKNKKGLSKNSNCEASILIVIKLNTRNTRKKDKFVKKGLQGVITIDNNHNHTLKSAESLRFLKSNTGVRETFFDYFADRMTIAEAIKYHESLFQNNDNDSRELFLASGSTNPSYR